MRRSTIFLSTLFIFSTVSSFTNKRLSSFPYKAANLNERQAAEHLLNRFTFGVRNEDIDEALKMGLEKWFENQLKGQLPDDNLENRLKSYDALKLSNSEIVEKYPLGFQLRQRAIREGLIDKNKIGNDNEKLKKVYKEYFEKEGIQTSKELERQTVNQKILRAIYSKNQLNEVLTDFWFNHFNVFMGKNTSTQFVLSYERDAIRPNVTNKFEDILIATAKSPAMLTYLDNFLSMKEEEENTKFKSKRKEKGLNENYAREIMELHTLGVDGGYTQSDVLAAAKILTGWTVFPMRQKGANNQIANLIDKIGEDKLASRGFVHEGDFLFTANRHESGQKIVLGKTYNQGGMAEGIALLKDLANHKATAQFISKKLATRFVNDNPDKKIVNAMASTFLKTKGDIKKVLWTMVKTKEFWEADAIHQKTKSPFEYAISAVRSMNAEVIFPFALAKWISKMGQKIYYYQAPTGFPDQGKHWINTGSLLNRMNFGLDLANGKIPGVKFNFIELLNHKEPESAEDAIEKYAFIFLPERDLQKTINRLTPLVNDPNINEKIKEATKTSLDQEMQNEEIEKFEDRKDKALEHNKILAQAIGILIGSPEFQRK